jgi:hypothetical protein
MMAMTASLIDLTQQQRDALACDMIEVHGPDAATIARDNARTAAIAGQALQAKSWLALVGIIQQRVAALSSQALTQVASGVVLPA